MCPNITKCSFRWRYCSCDRRQGGPPSLDLLIYKDNYLGKVQWKWSNISARNCLWSKKLHSVDRHDSENNLQSSFFASYSWNDVRVEYQISASQTSRLRHFRWVWSGAETWSVLRGADMTTSQEVNYCNYSQLLHNTWLQQICSQVFTISSQYLDSGKYLEIFMKH